MTTLSPSFNPSFTIQLLPTRLPTFISVGFSLLLSVSKKTWKIFCSWLTDCCGMTMAFLNSPLLKRTLTYWPGLRIPDAFLKIAWIRMDPVFGSICRFVSCKYPFHQKQFRHPGSVLRGLPGNYCFSDPFCIPWKNQVIIFGNRKTNTYLSQGRNGIDAGSQRNLSEHNHPPVLSIFRWYRWSAR